MRFILLISITLFATTAHTAPSSRTVAKRKPAAVVFVIDRSASMAGKKLEHAKQAVLAGIEVLAADDVVSVIAASAKSRVVVRYGMKSQRHYLAKVIGLVASTDDERFDDPFEDAHVLLADDKRRRHVVLITNAPVFKRGVPHGLRKLAKTDVTLTLIGLAGSDRPTRVVDQGDWILVLVDDSESLPRVVETALRSAVP
ncbi:MAG TPA: VWA domain-containing protein [Kofleriaceae bacterium]